MAEKTPSKSPDNTPAIRLARVDIKYDADPVVRGVSLDVPAHELHVLLGESGSGKTTILRAVAGFEQVSAGAIELFGETVDQSGDRRSYRPPERRHVGVVFQDYALFPHLDVAGNIAFGMAERSPERISALLDQVGLAGLGSRAVAELSGGQQQRVALARALAQRPRIILLDEPFSNLNRELRDELRERTAAILRRERITAVFVTHDRHEAFAMADRISVIGDGKVLQTGTPAEIYETPASEAVAKSAGDCDLIPAEIRDGVADCALGRVPVHAGPAQTSGRLVVRPETLTIVPEDNGEPDGVPATVETAVYFGAFDQLCLVLAQNVRVTAHARPGRVRPGDRVRVHMRGPAAWVP